MAEINQPTPIMPIWPTRRDGTPVRKKQPPDAEEEKRRRPSEKESKDGPPARHIDDFA